MGKKIYTSQFKKYYVVISFLCVLLYQENTGLDLGGGELIYKGFI